MVPPYDVSTKFEINLHQSTGAEIAGVGTFMIKNRIGAIVVPPELYPAVVVDKQVKLAQYKIIVAIDFENNGKNYALDKFRHLSQDIFLADGFDILLTPGVSDIQTNNEMKALTTFIKQLNQTAEIRWVLNCRQMKREEIKKLLIRAKENPFSYIRTDSNVANEVDVKDHDKDINYIKRILNKPVKISGGITYETFKALKKKVGRFDVTVNQAKAILHKAMEERLPKPTKDEDDEEDVQDGPLLIEGGKETKESEGGKSDDEVSGGGKSKTTSAVSADKTKD